MKNEIIAERLRIAREQLGITKAEASRRLKLTPIGYGRYESGNRTPSAQMLQVIAQCFGTSVSYLTGETTDMRPDQIVVSRESEPDLFMLVEYCKAEGNDMVQRLLAYCKKL